MKLTHFLKKKSSLKNILTLISGTFVAQLIVIFAQPLLRRIIPAQEFGVYAVYMSLVGILTTVIALRYDLSIVLPKEKETAENLVFGGILISFILSLFLVIPLYFLKNHILSWLSIPAIFYKWFYLIPFSVFFAGSYRVLNNWLIRQKEFKKSTTNKVIRRSTEATTQITFGVLSNPISLFLGDLLGSFANFLMGIYLALRSDFSYKSINTKALKANLIAYRKFPLYNTLPVLLNTAALLLPIIFINHLYNEQITAYFDLSRQILGMSLALFSAAISQVYLQKLSEKRNLKQKLMPDIIKAIKVLALLSFFGVVIIELFGESLFSLFFGQEYIHSGVYAKIMVLSFGLRFIVTPLSIAFISLERLKLNAVWQIFYFTLIMLLLSFQSLSIEQFLIRYVTIDLIAYSAYFILIIRIIKQHDNTILK